MSICWLNRYFSNLGEYFIKIFNVISDILLIEENKFEIMFFSYFL